MSKLVEFLTESEGATPDTSEVRRSAIEKILVEHEVVSQSGAGQMTLDEMLGIMQLREKTASIEAELVAAETLIERAEAFAAKIEASETEDTDSDGTPDFTETDTSNDGVPDSQE